MARDATATRPSSRRTCTSPTATRSTGCTPKYRIFTYTFELYPTEKPTVWADHYPDDSKIATQTARNRPAILLPHRPRRPARTRPSAPAPRQQDCGPLFDDLEINRGWSRDAARTRTPRPPGCGRSRTRRPRARMARSSWARASRGQGALVTGAARGPEAPDRNDVDGGVTIDPQPPDRAAGRSRELRPADLLATTSPTPRPRRPPTRSGCSSRPRTAPGPPCSSGSGRRPTSTRRGDPARCRSPAYAGQTIRLVVAAKDGGERQPRRGRGRQHPHPAP